MISNISPSGVAQLVERVAVNHQVGGSSPSSGAKKERLKHFVAVIPFSVLFKSNELT